MARTPAAAINPHRFREVDDPSALADTGQIYTNDIASITELMFKTSTGAGGGAEIQMTSAGTINGAAVGGFVSGAVVFGNGTGGLTQDASNLFWDNATNRLGIGTATPSSKLHVIGDAMFKGTAHEVIFFEGGNEDIYLRAGTTGGFVTINDNHDGDVILAGGGGDTRIGGTTTFNTVTYTWPGADGSASQVLTTDGAGALSWTTPAAGLGGSGTLNTLSKFTPDGTTLGDSQISDDGTNVTIGTATTLTGFLMVRKDQSTGTRFTVQNNSTSASAFTFISAVSDNPDRSLGIVSNSLALGGEAILSSGLASSEFHIRARDTAPMIFLVDTSVESFRLLAPSGTLQFADGIDIAFNTTVGTKIGAASNQKMCFWGIATPIVQPAHIVDADGTLADITAKFNTLLAQHADTGLHAAA